MHHICFVSMSHNTLHVQHNTPQLLTNMDKAGINWKNIYASSLPVYSVLLQANCKGYAQKASITQNMCSGALMEVYPSPDYVFIYRQKMVIHSEIMAVVRDQKDNKTSCHRRWKSFHCKSQCKEIKSTQKRNITKKKRKHIWCFVPC